MALRSIRRMSPVALKSCLAAVAVLVLRGCASDESTKRVTTGSPGTEGEGEGGANGAGGANGPNGPNRPNGGGGGANGAGGTILDLIDWCTGPYCPEGGTNPCVPGVTVRALRRHILGTEIGSGTETEKDECNPTTVTWTTDGGTEDVWTPPPKETYSCPAGTVRVHVRDMWSDVADPTLKVTQGRPATVGIVDVTNNFLEYWSRQESEGCDWYSTCLPKGVKSVQLEALGVGVCSNTSRSATLSLSGSETWISFSGSGTISTNDYGNASKFLLQTDKGQVKGLCADGKPPETTPDGMVKVHVRYPWADPSVTGFPGTNCGKQALGYDVPPYPTSLTVAVTGGGASSCGTIPATLDFQDGTCPWYTAYVPKSALTGSPTINIKYPDWRTNLATNPVPVPTPVANEIWVAYAGPPDDASQHINGEGEACKMYALMSSSYAVYSANPGPGYEHCGGGSVSYDPCSPPMPTGYHTVHFRYLWAGQKTFTFFPKPELMSKWIVLEVKANNANMDVICTREADRPWFNCQVPDSFFAPGATWRAVDKVRMPTEWNTVQNRPFPDKPGEYWIRWDYGKPDTTPPDNPIHPEWKAADRINQQFRIFDYYPDGTGGDWSATGNWHDDKCAPKPPSTPVKVGYDFGGWFPYARTKYAYPFGSSLAKVYANSTDVQDMLNTLVFQRYEIWKRDWIATDAQACGPGTARVAADIPTNGGTVSEGQGYGMAISAAIGDKDTFDKLWNFVRHFYSQSAKKYCGGLMAWEWLTPADCRPLDKPCDVDAEGKCNGDSAFDGDVDIGIGLVYAARQWPEYQQAAVGWLLKMECEVNAAGDGWNYPSSGDTWNKNCAQYPCTYDNGDNNVYLSYYPPGYFRVFGDFLAGYLDPMFYNDQDRDYHRKFWYRTAQTVYEMYERCYDQADVNPGLTSESGTALKPCGSGGGGGYNWSRQLWRTAVDAAWFGNRTDLPENTSGSSRHYPSKTQMQAKIDNIQEFYSNFYKNNPPEPNANRFSTICQDLMPDGLIKNCDPALGHNSYFVNAAMAAYATVFDNGGKTTPDIRKEALEEAVSTTVENDRYYQESIGVYTLLFLTGNFPNPLQVP